MKQIILALLCGMLMLCAGCSGRQELPTEIAEVGEVLLPPYPLELDEVVTFGLKKVLFVQYLTYKGIKV